MHTTKTPLSLWAIAHYLQICAPIMLLHFSQDVHAQQNLLNCNSPTPWVQPAFSLTVSHSSPGLACWEGDGILCPGSDVPANVINASTTDFAEGNITGLGSLTLRVTDNSNDYDAGNFAGFRVASELLEIGLFTSVTISTYLDNVLAESVSAGSLLIVGANIGIDQYDIGFVTSANFDAIEVTFDNLLGIGSYRVYYAILEDFCEGPALECNMQTPMNLPDFPVTIDFQNTGSGGITIGEVLNAENAISSSTTDFASLVNIAGIAGSTFISIEEQLTDYPGGTFAGFDIQNLTLVGAGILTHLEVTTFLDNAEQESFEGPDLLISGSLLGNSGRQTVGFITSLPFDEVKLTVNQPVGLNLGTTRVYSAIFQAFCEGPPLPCNELVAIHNPEYPVVIDGEHTGFTGVACALCDVINVGNVIDDDLSNYAEIIVVAGVTSAGSLAVKDALADYPAGTFAGFHIENPSLVDANVLTGITVSTYLDGNLQESETNLGALITVGTGLLTGTGEQYVGFVTTLPFDEVKITLANIIGSFNIGETRIYSAVFQHFCETVIECDTTYYWTNPEFPVYVDAFLTGVDGVACVVCEIDDVQNVITESNADYATITVAANVIGSASIAVADALFTYPPGTFAGFVIEDLGFLLEAELFESLTISTYNDGELQEFRTGVDLIDLAVLILFISADEGRYNVGFETTLPFDEIRITAGSLVTAINLIRVYSAFVDTRSSDGGGLVCRDGPDAVDDFAETNEEVLVIIDVLANDMDDESPLGIPMLVEGPGHGEAVLNPDSTFTYTPDDNFVGLDTFSYSICNDDTPPLCDTALVIITVYPVMDTIEETIPQDSFLMVCANELTTFNNPATLLTVCDDPEHGEASASEDCVTYTPDPGFTGNDTFCVVTCHPDLPALCDTTIVIVVVTPVNFPPDAVDDEAVTDEGVPVTIDVLENDSDPDDPLGFPSLVEPPAHGMVVVNLDSTFTYTPDPNFVGIDTFTYAICDDGEPPLCDTALVIIIVNPDRDTMEEIITQDSLLELCISAWVEMDEPQSPITICGQPQHGMLTVIDTCFQYIPDPVFVGEDTICVVACDVNELCDTTVIIIIIDLPLPVVWLSFDVWDDGPFTRLHWKTAFEQDNAGFEIERSPDGIHFEKIGDKPPGEGLNHYAYTDKDPLPGMNYYRIRQLDHNGRHGYSPVRMIVKHVYGGEMMLWPNPAASILYVRFPEGEESEGSMTLIQQNGAIALESHLKEVMGTGKIGLGGLQSGYYTLIVRMASGKKYVHKLAIVK